MIYNVRASGVEAERVVLADQKLYAVKLDDKAHLIPGEVFELLYEVAIEKPESAPAALPFKFKKPSEPKKAAVEPAAVKPAAVKPAAVEPAAVKRTAPAPAKPEGPKLWQRALKILQDFGPLTHAELASHLNPNPSPHVSAEERKKASDSAYAVESDLRSKGLIERVEDNGLDKWAAKK